jgi:FMN phosphatase YigB (HAD superfamily)
MKIGIDLDGVLADFSPAYAEKLTKKTGIQFPTADPNWPAVWHFDYAAGAKPGDVNAVWEDITRSNFWAQLLPMRGALEAIRQLDEVAMLGQAEVYFITARPGKFAKRLSEFWLARHGNEYPTVIIAKDKGSVAKGLELDVFVDDMPENVADVFEASKKTRVYLVDHPYNRNWAIKFEPNPEARIRRVASLMEVLEREGLARKVA